MRMRRPPARSLSTPPAAEIGGRQSRPVRDRRVARPAAVAALGRADLTVGGNPGRTTMKFINTAAALITAALIAAASGLAATNLNSSKSNIYRLDPKHPGSFSRCVTHGG